MKRNILVDIIIVLLVAAALVAGYLTFNHFRQTADKQIEKTSKIAFQVFLRGVTLTGNENPIKVGDTTFISIRNVPYTDLKVVDSKIDTKKILISTPGAKMPVTLVQDFSQIFMYDIIVTVVDNAKITKDGAVVGGNKIKMGLPITLEGKDYKFNGTVSNVVILPESAAPTAPQAQTQTGLPVQPQAPAKPTAQPAQPAVQQQPAVQTPSVQTTAPKASVQPKASTQAVPAKPSTTKVSTPAATTKTAAPAKTSAPAQSPAQ